jgi:hypothetical protein
MATRTERELPRIARDIAPARIKGRLIFSSGHGRDFSYYRKVVRKVHFSFAIDFGQSPDSYGMILPLAESARWVNPSGGFGGVGAKGSSGSAIVDAATGQIVGVLSAVTQACLVSGQFVLVSPGAAAEGACNFVGVGSSVLVGIWSSAERGLPLLRESRARAGFQ